MTSGIYKITNLVNNKIYIGSAVNLSKRRNEHFNMLRKNKHCNSHLQGSFNRYGEGNFKFDILEGVEIKEDLIGREQFWLDKTGSYNEEVGYNICPIAGSRLGAVCSEEHKAKISESNKGKHPELIGRKMSEKTRQALLASRLGSKHTEETKERIRQAKAGIKQSAEYIEKRVAPLRGRQRPDEVGNKISESKRGLTDEQVKEIREAREAGVKRKDLADKYGVSISLISRATNGKQKAYSKD